MLLPAPDVAGDESGTTAGAAHPNDMIESLSRGLDMESLPAWKFIFGLVARLESQTTADNL